ncbi:glycosyltransferase involved in cell wall biosynthesis [Pseudomonas sp. ADAK2 TE3594]
MNRHLLILGIRGIPAQHGGFETFAEKLAVYLKEKGWRITVYCQESGSGAITETDWRGIRRVHIPVSREGALGTVIFDFKAVRHALREKGLFLTLGYNTAIFNLLQRAKGQTNIINMDGIEWRREKWGPIAKTWFWMNERLGCWIGNHLVADHPKIKDHLATRVSADKITMIPYGGDEVKSASVEVLAGFSLEPKNFSIIIARPEPENSFFEMVDAFSSSVRNHKLVVLGNFTPNTNEYHKKVMDAASDEVIFPGAIYDANVVQALRYFSCFYLHGHRVGGTNPSLVEALGAGCAIIAHDNPFNRWVVGEGAAYFSDKQSLSRLLDELLVDEERIADMKEVGAARFVERFKWEKVLSAYEQLFLEWRPS